MEDQNPADDEDDAGTHDLVAVEEEVEKGEEEMTEDESHADPEPARALPRVGIDFADGVPEGLLGNIGAVDEELL